MIRKHRNTWILVLLCLAVVFGILSLGMGRFDLSIGKTVQLIWDLLCGRETDRTLTAVLLNIRLPRMILAFFAGAGLSVAGAAFQSIFSNPLATPDTLGVATGSSLGAVVGLLFGFNVFFTQGLAIAVGMLVVALVYAISNQHGTRSIIMLILAGMVISSLCQALISVVKLVADPQDQLPTITFWLMGSLSSITMSGLYWGLPFIIFGIVLLWLLRWKLNGLSLSAEEATTMGINVKLVQGLVILSSTMITAAIISLCGQIGWMGLLVPHISRMLFGNNNQYVIPASISIGALLFLIIDTVARTVSAAEIPVSILTAIIGAPLFIVLLRRSGGFRS